MGRGGVGVGGGQSTTTIMQQQSLHFEPLEQAQQTPVIDEFLEQIFAMPWEYNNAGAGGMGMERAGTGGAVMMAGGGVDANNSNNSTTNGSSSSSMGAAAAQKLFTMSLMPTTRLLNNGGTLGALGGQHVREEKNESSGLESGHYSAAEEAVIAARLHQQQQQQGKELRGEACAMERVTLATQEPGSGSPGLQQMNAAAGPRGSSSLVRSVSMGSSGSEDSGGQPGQGGDHSSSPSTAPTWQQPYVGVVPPLPTNLAHAKAENTLGRGGEFSSSHDNTQTLGKRFREDEEGPLCENHSGITQGNGHTSAASVQGFGGSSQQGLPAVGIRPRVRARRGQATDPHSIAERLRRERIAERMKALQELVPNSNKTDKASMLDEIIDYLKFLQLQVKILSMSRLGGAGAVASTASDLPAEGSNNVAPTISRTSGVPSPVQDGLALTEKQVTRLMEDDMGSAMQYLQSKGLCLMPIALATAISTTNSRGATAGVGDRQRTTVAASNGGLVTDGLVIKQSSKDNNRDVESAHTTTSMPINKAPKGEGKPSDGP
ncbi:hypothetical protein CY35_01G015800 [Sphagnum magellanicum]|nr:hypothetical protein CY35_01G015800 [Sphagnum magellanicum]KAH9573723.1 hypothetical protein CY35_01G015800 [Sphagnum magellanicum]KAH9573724.1 hypothetical protein CY35_01G015800 [Sphagnum magellanicum]KAH9573725.1 hypothetical protein CY35_01G015800 [Sphagnum magellanicum]KAH9573726.1 hypothetical protein CY35_01G015800 [Sphagnum magellanicum]